MNRILAFVISVLFLIPLCSCAKPLEAEPREPQSIPDLESIVEPIEGGDGREETEYAKPEDVSSEEEESASVTAAEDEAQSESVAALEESFPVQRAAPIPEERKDEADISGRLGALAAEKRYDSELIEKELLSLINSLRDEAGVNALGIEDAMQFAARIRSAEALESFSHTRPDGTPYNTAFDEAGFSYAGKWHGENLSYVCFSEGFLDEGKIALEMFNSLKSSPGHRRNMVEKNFVQVGIGVAINYNESIVDITSSQMFSSL